jgi:transposase InsO family protein
VIEKYNLYYDAKKAGRIRTKKNKNRGKKKLKIHEVNPRDYLSKKKPFFFCCDTIVLYLPGGLKRYVLTAVEYKTKIAYARAYTSKSSLCSFDFLLRLQMLVDGKISAVLSDNGSEFARYFESACRQLNITHIYTRVRTPQDNGINERFNRTVREEFMDLDMYFEPALESKDMTEANQYITTWLIEYNFRRPHQALDYQKPIGYYQLHYQQQKLLPMYPSITNVFKCWNCELY